MPSSKVGSISSTGYVSGNFICTWELQNFSKLNCFCRKSYDSSCIRSSSSVNQCDSWYLQIFPGGSTIDNRGFVSLYLCCQINYRGKMKVQCVVDLRNTDEKIIITAMAISTDFDLDWGFPQLIERGYLLSELVDDVLLIHVRATYSSSFIADATGNAKCYPELNSELTYAGMERLHIEKTVADVVISVGEEDIPAHYVVLAARSKVFAAMFEHDTIEKSSSRVSINDFDVDSVKAMLQFMYMGCLDNLTVELAEEMLRAADKYDIEDLKIYCTNYLISRLEVNIGDVGDIAIIADRYNAAKLEQNAIQFISSRK